MTLPGDTDAPSLPHNAPPRASGTGTPARAGEPAPPGTFDGRARSFREGEAVRRRQFRDRAEVVVVVVIIALGVIAILTAKPFVPSNGSNFPAPGPPIEVGLARNGTGNVTCGNGETAHTEDIVYTTPDGSVTTGDISPRLYEAFDQDLVPDIGVVANATRDSVCAGAPPASPFLVPWYVVLLAPNRTIQLTYTFDQGWKSVTNGAWNYPVENGTTMVVVTSFALPVGTYGFAIVGYAGGSSVHGTVLL